MGDETYDDAAGSHSPNGASFEVFTRTTVDFDEIVVAPPNHADDQAKSRRLVPGDVFYKGYSRHIAVVSSIEYGDDGRVKDISLARIYIWAVWAGTIVHYVVKDE